MQSYAHKLAALAALLAVSAIASLTPAIAAETAVPSVAVLEIKLINDNEGLDPTSDAERARQVKLEEQFKTALTESGRYTTVPVTDEIKKAIVTSQALGECGGCEVEFGKKLGADRIAWINVQKISNLILNMNVYMADVKTNKMTFIKSVDIRGNTDESWSRSLKYLLNNYFLIDNPESGNVSPKSH